MNDAYRELIDRVRDVERLGAVSSLLDWDQEVYMPPAGVAARAEQTALIAGIGHERLVCDAMKQCLERAEVADDDDVGRTNVREARRVFDRNAKLPKALVERIAHTASTAKSAWSRARRDSDFTTFAPSLSTLLELKREVAERIGYEDEPYDALMDEFEPGARSRALEPLFERLRDATVTLLDRIRGAADPPDASILTRSYPRDRQERLARRMAEMLHFDFQAGRADVSTHPFCTTIGGPGDVRITTRYNERFLSAALFGTLHETGHALYEQGLLAEHAFTPMGQAVSLGIHESQSRLWENLVGRGRAFWTGQYADLKALFPESLGDVSLDAFWRAINRVEPSLIRVEADELTYNLHIILRFEIERQLVSGALAVSDVPDAWNEKMRTLLGITPDDDAVGCLQDIHWSLGVFGYFPTYALGNLYAAQFHERAAADLPDLTDRLAASDTRPLLDWLRENIHRHGQRYRAGELIEVVTGRPPSIEAFLRYAEDKFQRVYGL